MKAVFFIVLIGLLAACSPAVSPTSTPPATAANLIPDSASTGDCSGEPLNVVVTIGMIADVAQNIGGACITVTALMRPGVDPHLYRASEGDVSTLLEADLIFYGGLHLEARMADIFEEMPGDTLTVAVSEAVPEDQRLTVSEGQYDPHVWMDVSLWRLAAARIQSTLVTLDPDDAALYNANADAYLSEMDTLHTYVGEQIATIPEGQRVLVTAHDAFQYFGRAYEIEVFAPQGISTVTEAGVEDIRRTIDVVVEREIPAVFVETSVPADVVEAILEGVQARDHSIVIGGSLYSDAMGETGTPDGTYLGMIRHNVDTIVAALTSTASEG